MNSVPRVKEYYTNLFKSRDSGLPNFNLSEVLNNAEIFKLSNSQALSLEGSITLDEIGNALKKNEKQ